MILDSQLLFTGGTAYGAGTSAIGQALTTTANSTNIIDLGPAPTNTGLPPSQTTPSAQPFRDIGIGDDPAMKLLVVCLTTFTSGTNMSVSFQGSPDNGSGAPAGFVTYYTSPTYTVVSGSLNAGSRLLDMDVPRPPQGIAEPRFLQLAFTISGTMATATILAAIVIDRFDQVYNGTNNAVSGGYPAGVVVAN